MGNDAPLGGTVDMSEVFEEVFKHPDGLLTARNLVRLMIHKMGDNHSKAMHTSQQTITNSFQVSRSISGLNPTMPNALKQILTFSDSNIQTFRKKKFGGPSISGDKSDSLEAVEQSRIKLAPSSDVGLSIGNSPFISQRSSHTEHNGFTKQTYFQNASCASLPLQNFSPAHDSPSSLIQGQPNEVNHQLRSELQQVNYHVPIPSPNTTKHLFGEPYCTSDLSTIDREFLGFNSMNRSNRLSSSYPSIIGSRPYTHNPNGRPHGLLLAPQPHKIPKLCTQHTAAMSFPHIASKSPDDREMLQVVEGFMPTNSAVSGSAATHSSSMSAIATKQLKKSSPKKRKITVKGESTKKPKLEGTAKAKRTPKPKPEKKELAKYQLDHAIWMRILEFAPVQFLGKARLICRGFRSMVDQFTSIYVNCRKENYGHDMPPPPLGLTERQYSNLLGSKGCLEPECGDKNASRTHWSWAKRWCTKCWKSKIEREDRLIKNRGDRFSNRTTLTKLLECIPVGMHDSFMKPHDYVDVDDNRPRGAPRLYKYYLKEDVEKIFGRYDELDPGPYLEDSTKTAAEQAIDFAAHQERLAGLDEKRSEFLANEKAKIDEHMALVQRIEAGVRKRRETNRTPYDENRSARKELFARRAREDLAHIDGDFVKGTIAFKAATRVFRDGGTERGWQTLKPKIEKEWEKSRGKLLSTSGNDLPQLDGAIDVDRDDEGDFDTMQLDICNSHTVPLQNHHCQRGCSPADIDAEYFLYQNWAVAHMHNWSRPLPPAPKSFCDARNQAFMTMGYNPHLSLPHPIRSDPVLTAMIRRSMTTQFGQAGNCGTSGNNSRFLSGPLRLPASRWQPSFSSSQVVPVANSYAAYSTESRGQIPISSLLENSPQ